MAARPYDQSININTNTELCMAMELAEGAVLTYYRSILGSNRNGGRLSPPSLAAAPVLVVRRPQFE